MKLEDVSEENVRNNSLMFCDTKPIPEPQHPRSKNLEPEVQDGIRLSDSFIEFKQVKSFKDFSICVNGLIINSMFSKHLLVKYYELCCSQKSFLHDHLLEGLNCGLITGIITETINIADAIRASKLTTSQEDFFIWEKTLKAFGDLGMNVGFLHVRLYELLRLALKSNRYKAARLEWNQAAEEKRVIEAKIVELNMTMHRLDTEIKSLARNDHELELKFQEVANAPWWRDNIFCKWFLDFVLNQKLRDVGDFLASGNRCCFRCKGSKFLSSWRFPFSPFLYILYYWYVNVKTAIVSIIHIIEKFLIVQY